MRNKKRNPYADAVRTNGMFRERASKSAKERLEHLSGISRKSKYKPSFIDEDDDGDAVETIQTGDEVSTPVGNGLVKSTDIPYDMIGITVDGEYDIFAREDIELIKEALDGLRILAESTENFVGTSGIRIPLSDEEKEIVDKVGGKSITSKELGEREHAIADRMVSRGILNREEGDDQDTYVLNIEKLYRD